jgi:hypothetical protein
LALLEMTFDEAILFYFSLQRKGVEGKICVFFQFDSCVSAGKGYFALAGLNSFLA